MTAGRPSPEHPLRHLLVVGGTRGIGLSVTRAALEASYRVTAIGRHRPVSAQFPASGAAFHALDLRKTEAISGRTAAPENPRSPAPPEGFRHDLSPERS